MTPLVEFRDIVKTFGGVHAVENVSLDLGEAKCWGCSATTAPANRR